MAMKEPLRGAGRACSHPRRSEHGGARKTSLTRSRRGGGRSRSSSWTPLSPLHLQSALLDGKFMTGEGKTKPERERGRSTHEEGERKRMQQHEEVGVTPHSLILSCFPSFSLLPSLVLLYLPALFNSINKQGKQKDTVGTWEVAARPIGSREKRALARR